MRRGGFVSRHAIIGEPAESRSATTDAGYYISPYATVEAFATVDSGTVRMTRIDPDAWLFKHSHVGHDAHIMEGAEVSTGAVIGGHCIVGPGAKIGLNATVLPWRVIGARARIGAGAVVTHDVPPGETWAGNPARKLEAKPSSSEHAHTTRSTQSQPASSTSPATSTASSAQATHSPAEDADALWWEWLASRDTSAKPTMPPQRPPGGFIEGSARRVPGIALSRRIVDVDL